MTYIIKEKHKLLAVKAMLLAILVWAVSTIVEGTKVEWVIGLMVVYSILQLIYFKVKMDKLEEDSPNQVKELNKNMKEQESVHILKTLEDMRQEKDQQKG